MFNKKKSGSSSKSNASTGNRTISRDLVVSLVLAVAAVSILTISLNFWILSRKSESQNKQKSAEYVAYLQDSLELPIWNFDEEGAKKIGNSFYKNELVVKLRIKDSEGNVIFEKIKEGETELIENSGTVKYKGQIIGHIELGLTPRFYKESNRQLLKLSLITMFFVILVLIGVTEFLLRVFLKRPLDYLMVRIDRMGKGDYEYQVQMYKQREIETIISKFNDMAEKIKARERSLSEINLRLEDEISKHTRAEAALRESEERYRDLFENANDLIQVVAPDGRLIYVNHAWRETLGYNEEEIADLTLFDTIHPDSMAHCMEVFERIMSGEKVDNFETVLVTKDGREILVEGSTSCKFANGKPVSSRGIFRNVTERKKLEKELLTAQKLESIGVLAGGIAHDFNNLLQGVLGYVELLLLDKKREDPEYNDLKEILRAAKRGGDLTRQLLAFSRRVESDLRPLDINHEVEQVQKMLERTIPKMIKIEINLADNLKIVNGDPSQVEQVLMNLAVNAKDAMPEEGRLLIETENVTLDEEFCKIHPDAESGDYILLTVSDTGHGMDGETVEHIFDPFYTTKGVGEGTGLGLSMVYGIVKSHNGLITCESAPGEGTSFKIYLPTIDFVPGVSEEMATGDFPGGTETILLVEDEEFIRRLGKRTLIKFGYRVLSAEDSESGLDIYRRKSNEIDLVILDLIMPGMGGGKCLEELLRIDPDTKVVVASGFSSEVPIKEALNAGARGFVGKPYDVREMLKVVREVLDKD